MKANMNALPVEVYERNNTPKNEGNGGGLCIVELVDGGYTPAWAEVEKAFWDGRNIVLKRARGYVPFTDFSIESENPDGVETLYQFMTSDGCAIFANGHAYDD